MSNQAIKQDTGKPDFTLVLGPLRNALTAMVRVREYGNRKYDRIAQEAGVPFDPDAWRQVEPRRYLASAARHFIAVIDGERVNDEDGGVEHMAQAMIDLGFAYEIELERKIGALTEPCPATQPSLETPVPEAKRDPGCGYCWDEDGKRQPLRVNSPEDLPRLATLVNTMARMRRWGGQTDNAITLARHCVMVAKFAKSSCVVGDELHRLIRSCLMHDAAEALYGDIPSPRKALERAMLPPGVEHPNDVLTRAFDAALTERYDLDLSDPRIKQADLTATAAEALERGIAASELDARFAPEILKAAERWRDKVWNSADGCVDAESWLYMWRRAGGAEE